MEQFSLLQKIIIWAIPLLFAITVHEVAHGWLANKLGDPTAKLLGRLTLNPIKHIDVIGTIIVPAILLFLGGFIFGWAKPVPVTWQNLKNPRRDMALVALAGPGANLLMALFWALIAKLGLWLSADSKSIMALGLTAMGSVGIMFNLVLMILNLIPIPPLDGSRVLSSLLPGPMAYKFNKMETYGFLILILLIASGLLGYIIYPLVAGFRYLIAILFGLQ